MTALIFVSYREKVFTWVLIQAGCQDIVDVVLFFEVFMESKNGGGGDDQALLPWHVCPPTLGTEIVHKVSGLQECFLLL